MDKIASPQILAAEIRNLLAYCQAEKPSRVKLAEKLTSLADRVSYKPRFPREFYVPPQVKNKPPMVPEGTDLAIWTWEENGVPFGIAFAGKANKPLWHHRFRNESQRQKTIDDSIDSRKRVIEYKQQRQKERREFQHTLKVGDVLYSSWGYDQTNVDFYEVTDVKGKHVILREIGKKVVRSETATDYVAAVPGSYKGPPMRRMPRGSGSSVSVRIDSVQTAYPWDGKPKYQTGWGYGH